MTEKFEGSQLVPKDLIGETSLNADAEEEINYIPSQLVPKDLIGETGEGTGQYWVKTK